MSTELRPAGGFRVGDAERARSADLLKEAHVAGYLTLDELDERLSAALAARTRDDLDRLVADLPPEWRARQGAKPAAPAARPARPDLLRLVPLALLLVTVVAAVTLVVATRGAVFPWPLLWVWFIVGRRYGHGRWRGSRSQRITWI
jgi:hypothetical protein